MDTGLEERVEVAEPDPAKVTNPLTGQRYPIIGYDETRRLAEQPTQIYVRVIRRPIYRLGSLGDFASAEKLILDEARARVIQKYKDGDRSHATA